MEGSRQPIGAAQAPCTRDPTRTTTGATPARRAHDRGMSSQPSPTDITGRRRRNPTFGQMADESAVLVTGIAAGAALMPGFLLCVPGVLFLVVVPLLAIGLVVAAAVLAVALAAGPLLLGWRAARRLRHGFAAAPSAPIIEPRHPASEGMT